MTLDSPTEAASTPSSTMNPPPTEKYVRSAIRFPERHQARAVSARSDAACALPGGNIVSRSKSRSRASSNPMLRLPASFSVFVARISATVASITAGSIVAGSFPDNPSSTARSVPCPMPVKASDPYRSHLHPVHASRVRPSTRARERSGTPRASDPSCANSKVQRQACKDQKDSSSRRRL